MSSQELNELIYCVYFTVAMADGEMHQSEAAYLEKLGKQLQVDPDYCVKNKQRIMEDAGNLNLVDTFSLDERIEMMIDVCGLTMIDGVQDVDEMIIAGKIHHVFGFPAMVYAQTYITIVRQLGIGEERPIPAHPKLVRFLDSPVERKQVAEQIKSTLAF